MNKPFRNLLRNYFNFTKGERNAFFVLVAVTLTVSIIPMVGFKNRHAEQIDFSLIKSLEAKYLTDSVNRIASNDADDFQEYPDKKYGAKKFLFNPNTATLEELQLLGFRRYLAERIVKFRNAGGKFYVKSDINKIYGISPDFANELMPYIDLPEKKEFVAKENDNKFVPQKYTPQLIDINTTDTFTLNKLKGIGNKLSQRILTFREKLGGFYSLEQLNEVYGLKPEVIAEIMPRFKQDFTPVRQMNINTATFEELSSHPYIRKNLAGIIINYRNQHGLFSSVDDLLKIKVLDETTFIKLKNYLKV